MILDFGVIKIKKFETGKIEAVPTEVLAKAIRGMLQKSKELGDK